MCQFQNDLDITSIASDQSSPRSDGSTGDYKSEKCTSFQPPQNDSFAMHLYENLNYPSTDLSQTTTEPQRRNSNSQQLPQIKSEPNSDLTLEEQTQIISHNNNNQENSLQQLQKVFEKNGIPVPGLSPKGGDTSSDEDVSRCNRGDYDDSGKSGVNANGKLKNIKCAQCNFRTSIKEQYWTHLRLHIKEDKQLSCPKCKFVTQYKHHLEYHLNRHLGLKPYKCKLCNYTCVNNSMLTSHMKSHSDEHPYRCADCHYTTKYCHSLKTHLKRHSHVPAKLILPDGTEGVIDTYGKKRGPRMKRKSFDGTELGPNQLGVRAFPHIPLSQPPPPLQLPFAFPFLGNLSAALVNPMFIQQQLAFMAAQSQIFSPTRSVSPQEVNDMSSSTPGEEARSPTDLVATNQIEIPTLEAIPEVVSAVPEVSKSRETSPTQISVSSKASDVVSPKVEEDKKSEYEVLDLRVQDRPVKNRRKGPSFRLSPTTANLYIPDEDDDEDKQRSRKGRASDATESEDKSEYYKCKFCAIVFENFQIYQMHMSFHDVFEPFTCSICKESFKEKVSFFKHITLNRH